MARLRPSRLRRPFSLRCSARTWFEPRRWSARRGLAIAFLVAACREEPAPPGGGAPEPSGEVDPPAPAQLERVGIQLYTLRAEMAADYAGTLRRVAELGYDEVEFDQLFGNDPAQVRALVQELGLSPVADHVPWEIVREAPERGVEEAVGLGVRYMVFAWLPAYERATLASWELWIDRINAIAALAREAGLEFAYHNHDFEFQAVEGVVPYELLLERLHPEILFELDFYWAALGGQDPLELFERHPHRFRLSHVKDMNLGDRSMADVGEGGLDFASAFAARDAAGMTHFFVERDDSADPWRTAEVSLEYLRALEF